MFLKSNDIDDRLPLSSDKSFKKKFSLRERVLVSLSARLIAWGEQGVLKAVQWHFQRNNIQVNPPAEPRPKRAAVPMTHGDPDAFQEGFISDSTNATEM